jgi:hypothetical protein
MDQHYFTDDLRNTFRMREIISFYLSRQERKIAEGLEHGF